MFAVTHAAVMQPVEAEGIDIGILREDLGEHVDEEIAVRPERAEHPAVRELLHVGGRNLRGVGRDSPPLRMRFVDLTLKRRRVDAEDADAEFLVLGNVLFELAEGHVRAAPLEQLAVVVGVEGIDEAHLGERDAVFCGSFARGRIHDGERVPAADGVLNPAGNSDAVERLGVERLRHHGAVVPHQRVRLCDCRGNDRKQNEGREPLGERHRDSRRIGGGVLPVRIRSQPILRRCPDAPRGYSEFAAELASNWATSWPTFASTARPARPNSKSATSTSARKSSAVSVCNPSRPRIPSRSRSRTRCSDPATTKTKKKMSARAARSAVGTTMKTTTTTARPALPEVAVAGADLASRP